MSRTSLAMDPDGISTAFCWRTGTCIPALADGNDCASAHTCPARPTTAAVRPTLSCLVIRCTSLRGPARTRSPRALRDHREGDVPLERLARRLVGQLDVEPVVPLREARKRHRQAARELMARREIELRRQRL